MGFKLKLSSCIDCSGIWVSLSSCGGCPVCCQFYHAMTVLSPYLLGQWFSNKGIAKPKLDPWWGRQQHDCQDWVSAEGCREPSAILQSPQATWKLSLQSTSRLWSQNEVVMIATFTHHNVGPTKGTVGLREATACYGESSRAPVPLLSNMILGIMFLSSPRLPPTYTLSVVQTPPESLRIAGWQ